MLDGFQDSFREEAYELLNNLEQSLLELEERPEDMDVISAVFRSMHTIKGSASMFGFDAISQFTHHVETMLDDVRNGRIPVSRTLIDLTLEARDHIRHMLEEPEDSANEERSHALMTRLQQVLQAEQREPVPFDDSVSTVRIGSDETADELPPGAQSAAAGSRNAGQKTPATWHIRFVPAADISKNGSNPFLLIEELHTLGDCTVVANTREIPDLDSDQLDEAHVWWDIFLTTDQGATAIQDVFIFVDDRCKVTVQLIDELDFAEDSEYKRLGQILVDRGVVDSAAIDQAVSGQKRLGEVLVGQGIDTYEVETALQEQQHVRRARQKAQSESAASSIRVHSEKLDELVDLVGELVTLQARLTQTADGLGGDVATISENFERLVSELRDHTMSIRMLPISTSFSRFRRLIRDLSQDLGKQVDLVTEGGETELDKTVIERLHDPLVHIIRNSIDHGIEAPATRTAAGKDAMGTIALRARHAGANVEVRIEDDGGGLDRERIRARAVERGVISADAQMAEHELLDLVFAAGFSTAGTVTTVSGRGVGMDVVRKEVENIGGSVALESVAGAGTTVVISIPLTLAIIDGLLVRIGEERFVIPLSSVVECIEFYRTGNNDGVVANRGEMLPVMDLRREFGIIGDRPEIEQAVVSQTGIGDVGFLVDAVIGDHQTVIKNLGKMYRNIEGVSGATILGDGDVALILDVQRLAAGKSHELHLTQ
ncbi:MAG: chemotaxis protein CheA [Alkalispirochaeta sp.]